MAEFESYSYATIFLGPEEVAAIDSTNADALDTIGEQTLVDAQADCAQQTGRKELTAGVSDRYSKDRYACHMRIDGERTNDGGANATFSCDKTLCTGNDAPARAITSLNEAAAKLIKKSGALTPSIQ